MENFNPEWRKIIGEKEKSEKESAKKTIFFPETFRKNRTVPNILILKVRESNVKRI